MVSSSLIDKQRLITVSEKVAGYLASPVGAYSAEGSVTPQLYISVVIPCYNAIGKIARCLASLRRIDFDAAQYEIIFVDDRSSDGTFEFLEAQCAVEPNWQVLRLEANTGSPSEPRNRGVMQAQGEFVFFLDCDDEIFPDTLRVHLDHAMRTGADIVRGYLIAENGPSRIPMNRVEGWSPDLSKKERIEKIIASQSTIPCSLIRVELLKKEGITWRSDLRMGEDTLFLTAVMASAENIEYLEHPTYIYVKSASFTPSSTQSYGNRELRDHLTVWRGVTEALRPLGVDYVSLRLQIGLQAALQALIFLNRGDVDPDTQRDFAAFLREHRESIKKFRYSQRLQEIISVAEKEDPVAFRLACRPRLLIAGYDLKFITGLLPQLEFFYDVRLDVWQGHEHHDAAASQAALDWAELIWCEWLLGNAVWYSRNKKPSQKLIVRMHRFELGRDFGDNLEIANVDAVVTVSTLFLERLLERFPSIPRKKARLQHNYVEVAAYARTESPDRHFRLAMIGILPSRKGLLRALSILSTLRRHDKRYTLDIFGWAVKDLTWLANNQEETSYYRKCEEFVEKQGLSDVVRFRGHLDIKKALAEYKIGIVLSLSDSVRDFPCFESFHLAVADGFAAGGVGLIRYWEGSEYVWPSRFIFASDDGVIARILEYRDDVAGYRADCEAGLNFVSERYSVDGFLTSFKALYRQ